MTSIVALSQETLKIEIRDYIGKFEREDGLKIEEERELHLSETQERFNLREGDDLGFATRLFGFNAYHRGSFLTRDGGGGAFGPILRYSEDKEYLEIGMRVGGAVIGEDKGGRRYYAVSEGLFSLSLVRADLINEQGIKSSREGFHFEMGGYGETASKIFDDACLYWGHNFGYGFRYEDGPTLSTPGGSEMEARVQGGAELGILFDSERGDYIKVGALAEWRPSWREGSGIDGETVVGGILRGNCFLGSQKKGGTALTAYLKCFDSQDGGDMIYDTGVMLTSRRFICELGVTNDADRYGFREGDIFYRAMFGIN